MRHPLSLLTSGITVVVRLYPVQYRNPDSSQSDPDESNTGWCFRSDWQSHKETEVPNESSRLR